MKITIRLMCLCLLAGTLFSCVSKKKYESVQMELEAANADLGRYGKTISDYENRLRACEQEKANIERLRNEQVGMLNNQISDLKQQRDKQVNQVGDLTVMSQSANENMKKTLTQLGQKDEYIRLLQAAKSKADSINLALAVNLKGVLEKGLADDDVEVKVDKTVVFVNLSDKMLYQSGSSEITPRASEVLGKIARIIESRPELEVMVEGHTDNVPINNSCIKDNWDLSVKRATSVVRVLQENYGVKPSRLIAAGRGEYVPLMNNDSANNRSTNRRTRIIILPKLNQFYDLLNPDQVPK